jgi:glycosyltransferase domain-containing protein
MLKHEKLTFILTIKDRDSFTLRWLTYANKTNFPFKILIADGGKSLSLEKILTENDRFLNLNYEYIRYPYDATYTEYYAKTLDALSRVKTPFAAIGQDDDFYFAEELQEAVDFLSVHKEYIAYNGCIDNFIIKPNTNTTYGKDVEFIKNPVAKSIDGKISRDRVWEHFCDYTHTLYSVYRIEVLTKNYKTLCKYNFTNLILHELILSFLTAAEGTVKRSNNFYLMRQINPKNSSNNAETQKKGDYLDRMLIDSWSLEFNQFVNSVAEIIAAKDQIALNEAQQFVIKGYREYIIPKLRGLKLSNIKGVEKWLGKEKTSLGGQFYNRVKSLSKESILHQVLRKYFHIYQNLKDAMPRPRPIYPTSLIYKKVQPIREFLTSPKEIDCDKQ